MEKILKKDMLTSYLSLQEAMCSYLDYKLDIGYTLDSSNHKSPSSSSSELSLVESMLEEKIPPQFVPEVGFKLNKEGKPATDEEITNAIGKYFKIMNFRLYECKKEKNGNSINIIATNKDGTLAINVSNLPGNMSIFVDVYRSNTVKDFVPVISELTEI